MSSGWKYIRCSSVPYRVKLLWGKKKTYSQYYTQNHSTHPMGTVFHVNNKQALPQYVHMYSTISICAYTYIFVCITLAIYLAYRTAIPVIPNAKYSIYISKQPDRFWATSIFMTLTNHTNIIHNNRIVYRYL